MRLALETAPRSEWHATGRTEAGSLPAIDPEADLGTWVFPFVLLAWGLDQAEDLRGMDAEPGRSAAVTGEPDHSRLTLAVVTFCLARRIYDNDAMARACRSDASLRNVCSSHGYFPIGPELRRFCRQNRLQLQRVLSGLFLRALRYRFDLGGMSLPCQLETDLSELALERLNVSRHVNTDE